MDLKMRVKMSTGSYLRDSLNYKIPERDKNYIVSTIYIVYIWMYTCK